ncbi:hypothetical protein BGZ79_002876 [Entomortierella chlamydospora]|nr:hypothetical protein BGZ79_002876 [Entomortierella chlamydospora]
MKSLSSSALLGALLSLILILAQCHGAEVRGNTPWSIILCKFKDVSDEPKSLQFFKNFATLAGSGTGNLADYYSDQSYGKVSLLGSEVRGWFVMSVTKAQLSTADRWHRVQACIDAAARGGYTVPAGNRIMTMLNSKQDSGADGVGPGARMVLDNFAWDVRFAAHEMGHVYGLQHSWSNVSGPCGSTGEYGDSWDEMSATCVYSPRTGLFRPDAVGFGGYQRDKLGWIPINRILTMGSDGISSRIVTLAPMSDPTQPGYLYVRIPFDPADLFHYYTVEFRTQTKWDAGILKNTVLIHEVRKFQFGPVIFMTSVVFRTNGGQDRDPAQSLVANGVVIKVTGTGRRTATVSISTDITGRCVQGFVWRQARPSDHVCVTAATRAQAQYDNAHSSERRQGSGPYGPDTCKQGYVWRDAWAGDHVCVTPATRTQTASDNAVAAQRVNPAKSVYGPNTCKQGYVWREADASDYVCVSAATRAQAKFDNAHASERRQGSGPYGRDTCKQGYVWREAWPNDHVCVTGATRSQTAFDNTQILTRLARPW